jgi:DHA3 family tetracycline resistance protein-like MFS transporter
MFPNLKLKANFVYLFIEFSASVFFSMMFVVTSLYEATLAGLSPFQLVLVGTALEISVFLFEVPTGIVADIYSRRLSIIMGYVLMGAGFLVEGFFPAFLPIVLAQIIWGLGYTFTSGSSQAWITDEIGEEGANTLFLRASQVSLFASLIGMGLAIWIGANNTALPIQTGALGVILIGITLIVIMPETGFHPTPREDRNTWQHMWHTFKQGADAVRSRPRLVNLIFVGLFYGLYSEGYDRLGVKFLLDHFQLPVLFGSNHVAFFALLSIIGNIFSIFVLRFVEKRLDTGSPLAIGRAMFGVIGLIALALIGFAFSPLLIVAVLLGFVIDVVRSVSEPLRTAWVNQKLDPGVRATVHSMFGQVDAIGQIASGPTIGLIANAISVKMAITISGLLLGPALYFVRRANLQPAKEADLESVLLDS